eukprot:m.6655 g.6655  ORF g.6655 m.6655 type:complete len:769 (+) comp3564_c0_seq1:124-2430(+)
MPPQAGKTLAEVWPNLQTGAETIFNNHGKLGTGVMSRVRHMELYHEVHNFCTNSRGQTSLVTQENNHERKSGASLVGRELYGKLREFLGQHCRSLRDNFLKLSGEELLSNYTKIWGNFVFSAKVCDHIFAYLNRFWVPREKEDGAKDVYEIFKMTLVVWREFCFYGLKAQLLEAILDLIKRDRNREKINTQVLTDMKDCIVALGVDDEEDSESGKPAGQLAIYKDEFEKTFLEKTSEFYTAESDEFLQENPVTEYMKKAEQRLEEENHRVTVFLHETTRDELAKNCEKVLIKRHVERLHGEFESLLKDERIEDLRRMYSLLARIPDGLEPLRNLLEKHVTTKGLEAVDKCGEADTDAKAYVTTLLATHAKFTTMVKNAFDDDPSFVAALDKACREFVNHNSVTKAHKSKTARSPELLAKYCDSLLKKSSKNAESEELESLLDGVMVIFRYLEDNDVFQKFYSKALAKRLVNSSSASDDSEASMISKLKQTCGYEWTQKFQRMFQNMGTSKELMVKFRAKVKASGTPLTIKDFYVMVLTSGSWPFNANSEQLRLPSEMEKCCERFRMFYMSEHQGRRLNWLPNLSKGEIVTNFTKDPKSSKPMSYTLQASSYQMAILLHFNDKDTVTLDELVASLQASAETLQGVLGVLLKTKLITLDGTNYKLNFGFKNKKIKVNINMPIKAEAKAESESVHQSIEEDRKMVIQAAIVRIMKTRKRMKHNELITTSIDQLKSRFQPKVPAIKAQIGQLIEKDYLERVEGTRDEYNYLA